jgi:hypothetical protein
VDVASNAGPPRRDLGRNEGKQPSRKRGLCSRRSLNETAWISSTWTCRRGLASGSVARGLRVYYVQWQIDALRRARALDKE